VLAFFAITSLVEAFGFGHFSRFIPLYLRYLGTPARDVPSWTGILSALVYIVGLPLIPLWGVWAEKYSRKAVIARSAYVEMVVFLVLAVSQNVYQLAIGVALVGFQLGNTGVMLAALRSVVPAHRVGLAISLFAVTPPLGIALGPTIGGLLVDHGVLSLRGLYLLDAVLSLGTGLMLTLLYREVRPANPPTEGVLFLARRAVRLVFTTRSTLALFGVFGLVYLGTQTTAPFFPLLVQRVHQGPGLATAIGLVFGASALVGALLSPIAGFLGDRYGFKRVLVGSTLLGALSLGGMALAPNIAVLAVAAIAFGMGSASSSSMVFALLATTVAEDRRSTTLNLSYVPLYIAGLTGGSLGALLARLNLSLVPLTGAVFALAASLVALRAIRPGAAAMSEVSAAAQTEAPVAWIP
jgi:MFS family permease